MAFDLIAMRKKVRKPLGIAVTDTDLTDADIDEYLNLAYWEIQDKFPFREKERTATFLTVAGQRVYPMPEPYEALKSLAVKELDSVSGQFTKLIRMDTDEYENRYNSDDSSQGFPTHYTREDCFFRLWPTPDVIYTMSMKRTITLEDLSATQLVPEIPRAWWEVIIYGAIWRAFMDYGDFDRSQSIKAHQIALLNSLVPVESKEEQDSREASVVVYRPSYDL
ncbi:MAG: hypothetical protein H0U60_09795 [Blastocatellia bacterium]|nr:hypothetical protein [Blastocatellia bacterium]